MRYITNIDGYLQEVSFGADIECDGSICEEYTGAVPQDYDSIEAWYVAESEKLYRWKIVEGSLELDPDAVEPEVTPLPEATGAVPKYFSTANYSIASADAGKILLPSYALRNSTIIATLDSSVTLGLPKGTEIAIVRMWGANLTIKTTGIRMAVPGVTSNGVGGITTADEQQFVIPKPFGTAILKKLDQDANGEVWVLQGDIEMLNVNNRTLTATAGQSIPISLKAGEIMQVSYLASELATGDITLKVNGAAPEGGYYNPSSENAVYSGGIITAGGTNTYASAQFFMQVVRDRLLVWGTGIRGNGSGIGNFNAFWKTTAPTSIAINKAGTVVYKKLS